MGTRWVVVAVLVCVGGCAVVDGIGGADDDDDDARVDAATPSGPDAAPTAGLCVTGGACYGKPIVMGSDVGVPTAVDLGDFDGDGVTDILVVGTTGASVWLNQGNGQFNNQPINLVSSEQSAVGRFNDDQRDDYAIISQFIVNAVNGAPTSGEMMARAIELSPRTPRHIAVADLDGALPHELVISVSPPELVVLVADASGVFGPPTAVATTVDQELDGVVSGNFGGDDRIDLGLLTKQGVLTVLVNEGGLAFTEQGLFNGSVDAMVAFPHAGPGVDRIALAHSCSLCGEHALATVVASSQGSDDLVRLPAGEPGPIDVADIAAGAFDAQAGADLVIVNRASDGANAPGAYVITNPDQPGYGISRLLVGAAPERVAAGDLDGDGIADLVFSHPASEDISIFLSGGP